MKKIFLLFFLVPYLHLDAQDYQNICSPGITFFKGDNNYLKAFRRDSVVALGGNDTLFISYRTIRYNYSDCIDTTCGSVLGREVIKTASGWFWFFNAAHDTLKINSQASLNDTWIFCNLPGHAHIEAKVTNIIVDSVPGTTDSVKVIIFQAKDSANNNIAHLLNGKFIKLSKHYGLSKMIDVVQVPSDTNSYQLAGKSVPGIGIRNLQWQEIFNFDVGDEFHYFYGEPGFNDPDPDGYESKVIRKILNKTWSGNDTVTYTEEICGLYSHDWGSTWTYGHRTDTEIFHGGYSWLPNLPDEFIRIGNIADRYSFMTDPVSNRRIKMVNGPEAVFFDSCWVYNNPHFFYNDGTTYLEEGLGCTVSLTTMAVGSGLHTFGTTLVYYKKGSETWGTPLAADCSALSGTAELQDPGSAQVSILPNPADEQTLVTMMNNHPGKTVLYSLYAITGTRVAGGRIQEESFVLMRNGLPAGLYILVISDTGGNVKARTRVLFK